MRNQCNIVNKQVHECNSAGNIDKGIKWNDSKQQIYGEDVVHEHLVEVKSQMSKRKTMILVIEEKLQNLQPENKSFRIQLEHISASGVNKYKASDS